MLRPFLYSIAGLLALVLLGYFTVAAPIADARFNKTSDASSASPSARAQALHDSLLVADLHNDLLLWSRDPLARHDYGHTDVPRLRAGGMGLQVFAAVTQAPSGRSYAGTAGDSDQLPYLVAAQRWPLRTWTSRLERALYQAQKLRRAVARDDHLALLRTRADLNRTVSRRRNAPATMGTLLAIEGLHALEGTAAHVDTLVDAGYRMMSLTHLHDNALGGSSTGLEKGGLTAFGERVLRRLIARNVVVDLAHASAPLLEDILARTEAPVVVSHTGVRATCDSPRNVTDRQIRMVAAQDGIVGIGLWEGAVCGETPAATARAMRHVADLVGVEHVALGSDFDGTVTVPFDAAGLPRLTDALLETGFSPGEIEQIMGGNVARLLRRTLPAADA